MTGSFAGRLIVAALFLAGPAIADPKLQALGENGVVLAVIPMQERREICLTWAHSVTAGKVADCFENHTGQLTLTRSYLHDFAAGLGEVEGRGRLTSDPRGGYWIMDINEAMPDNRLALRTGAAEVGHRLVAGDESIALPLQTAVTLILTSTK